MRLAIVALTSIAGLAAAQTPPSEVDQRLLRDHKISIDAADLLRFFRERTLSPKEVAALESKIALFGSSNFAIRDQAAADLVKAGHSVKALLLDVIRKGKADLEITRRAELCLRQIEAGKEAELAQAAARELARLKPPQAAATLIAYVPFVADDGVGAAVQQALNATAVRDHIADPALVRAVADAHPGKRAAAGEALVRAGGLDQKAIVAPLLSDPDAAVRLPIAIALAEAKDKDAMPALIDRLVDAPDERRWEIQDMLLRLAGDEPPVHLDGKTPVGKARELWLAWWKEHQGDVDLAKLTETPPYLGYTLITMMTNNNVNSAKLVELRPDGEVNFEIDNLSYPVDARIIAPGRVLIAEYMGRRITERDFKGDIVWELPATLPLSCQRLPGGLTFVATRRQLLTVDAEKRTVSAYNLPANNGNINAAHKLRDGSMVFVASTGLCQWLDPEGNPTKSFPVGSIYSLGGNIDVLPNRHVIAPLYRDNQVAEFDTTGAKVWSAKINSPISAQRLPNGDTLVVTMSPQRVVRLSAKGDEVWSYSLKGRGWRARGR